MSEKKFSADNSHKESAKLRDEYWEKSQKNPIIKGLNSGKSLAEVLRAFPDFKEGFKKGEILNCVKCSDGRVNNTDGGEKLGLAGSGILFNESELDNFVHRNYGQIKEVTSHENCGAGAVKYAQMVAAGETMPEGITNSDELAQWFAKKMAKLLGANYRHIAAGEFTCPVHRERLVVIDGTAKFDPNQLDYFPPTFISAALGLGADLEYVAKEARLLAGISLGNHGFDARFNSENPFYLMIIADNQNQLTLVKETLQDFVDKQNGRVKLVGVLRPE